MKAKYLLASAVALTLATAARADVQVDITGATAFRAAALTTIHSLYAASGKPFKFAHDQAGGATTPYTGATRAIFIGELPNIPGITTIRTSFNGSVEGINALVDNTGASDPTYLLPSVLDSTTATLAGAEKVSTNSPTAPDQSEFAFSDVNIASTPFTEQLLPADASVGVVTFTMLLSEGVTAGAAAPFDNITTQQFKALFSNGFLALSVFTGNPDDADKFVFATGRNDGSGTRTTYLAETGYGIANAVQQYIVPPGGATSTTINQIRRVPQGDGNNASTIWGKDIAGNGGYSSGSSLRSDMGKTTGNVQVLETNNSVLFTAPLYLLTFLSTSDAEKAIAAGAHPLKYNGVGITPTASGLSPADTEKITQGQYTAWGYQQLYRRADMSNEEDPGVKVYNAIKEAIGANLDTAGIPLDAMQVGREQDGGPVFPIN